ncbi:MAG: hypothetical protein K0U24_07325 [Gammaproteobacteria bacterium]|nr:hypothetical protein [Gammaproteobacteria bacterium]
MKTSSSSLSLEEEIASLRKEVQALRQKQSKADALSKKRSNTQSSAKSSVTSEAEFKKILTDISSQIKQDYDNLSPVTALLLFALGTMLGSTLTRTKGNR